MIYHVFTDYAPADPETARRNRTAQSTWPRQSWQPLPVRDADLPRMWLERGRAFPYIRDVLDIGVEKADPEDIIIYTNADIMVRGDCCAKVSEALQTVDACFSYRRDFHHRIESPVPDRDFEKGYDYPGSDLEAFRAGWWRHWRGEMPDMLIGAEAYDPVLRELIMETNHHNAACVLRDVICHERHASYWENPAHRYKLKSQWHNIGLAKAFFIERGINPGKFCLP